MCSRSRLGLSLLLLTGAGASGGEPALTKSPLFEAGQSGYALYRIPGIVVTSAGTILVYCEARRLTGGDWDTIDIVMRRSTESDCERRGQRLARQINITTRIRVL